MQGETVALPDGIGWLAQASAELQAALAKRCDRIALREGRMLFRAGDPGGGLYGVVAGRLDMHLPRWGAERSLAQVVGPGWWVGDLAAVTGEPRRFEVHARPNTTLLRLSRAEIARLTGAFPEMPLCLLAMLSANMRHLVDAAESLGFADPTRRIAACLLRVDGTGPGWAGLLPLTQADLAVIANLSRRRTNCALSALESAGLVQLRYGSIELCDRARLQALTDGQGPDS